MKTSPSLYSESSTFGKIMGEPKEWKTHGLVYVSVKHPGMFSPCLGQGCVPLAYIMIYPPAPTHSSARQSDFSEISEISELSHLSGLSSGPEEPSGQLLDEPTEIAEDLVGPAHSRGTVSVFSRSMYNPPSVSVGTFITDRALVETLSRFVESCQPVPVNLYTMRKQTAPVVTASFCYC